MHYMDLNSNFTGQIYPFLCFNGVVNIVIQLVQGRVGTISPAPYRPCVVKSEIVSYHVIHNLAQICKATTIYQWKQAVNQDNGKLTWTASCRNNVIMTSLAGQVRDN